MVHWKYHGILKTAWMHSVLPRACVDETRHEARGFTFQATFSRNSKVEAGASSTHLGLVLCLLLALRWLPLWDSISDTAEQGAGHSTDLPGEGLSCVCSPGHHAKGLQQGFMEHCREVGPERPKKEPKKARKSHPVEWWLSTSPTTSPFSISQGIWSQRPGSKEVFSSRPGSVSHSSPDLPYIKHQYTEALWASLVFMNPQEAALKTQDVSC